MATIDEMRQVATQIENETTVGGNTAERVGGLFNDIVDKLEDIDGITPLDDTPTRGSVKGVKSGGVYNVLDEIWGIVGRSGGTSSIPLTWEQGALTEGVEQDNATRIRTTGYISLANYPNGIHIETRDGSFAVFTFSSQSSSGYTTNTGWLSSLDIPTGSNYIRIVAKNAAGTNITPSYGTNVSASTTIPATDGLVGAVAELQETKVNGNGTLSGGTNPLLTIGSESYEFTPMLSVDANGNLQVILTGYDNLGNATSNLFGVSELIMTPNSDDVIFKVVYYDANGGYISATPYMARTANAYVTSANVVSSYTISNARCRIVLAYTTLQRAARDAETLVSRIDFSGASAVTQEKYYLFPIGEKQIMSDDFRANVNVRKVNGKWEADFNPHDHILPSSTTAYISPNGVDTNDGKSPLTPVQTVGKALTVGDTIVFLGGTYTAGTHFVNGVTITGKNLVANGAVTIDCDGGAPFHVTGNCYVEGIAFVNGNDGSLNVELSSVSYVVCLSKCEFNQSVGSSFGGLVAEGGTLYVYRCKANDNIKDGFNYHKTSGNVVPHVTEIECEAWRNGNSDSYTSNNGTTAHDGAQVLRVCGNYGYCKGGVLADVNSGTLSVNYGCKVLSSSLTTTDAQYQASVFCGSGAVIWLVDCALSGSTYAISSINSGSVVRTNVTYTNNYTASGGVIMSFNV